MPHQCAHWFAMTLKYDSWCAKQKFIAFYLTRLVLSRVKFCRFGIYFELFFLPSVLYCIVKRNILKNLRFLL